MTKKDFRYDMQRGLGSCIKELKSTENMDQFRSIILWGCNHEMQFNGQLEDRSIYLYELITEFPDCTPFIDVVEKNLFQNIKHRNWIFLQDCDILSFFTFDGNERTLAILEKCYKELFQLLLKKQKRVDGFPERRNFEELCISFIKLCFDDTVQIIKYYKRIVNDIGTLIQKNNLYSADDFEWFQTVSEKELGKKKVYDLLHHANVSDATRTYVLSIKECSVRRTSNHSQQRLLREEVLSLTQEKRKDSVFHRDLCLKGMGVSVKKEHFTHPDLNARKSGQMGVREAKKNQSAKENWEYPKSAEELYDYLKNEEEKGHKFHCNMARMLMKQSDEQEIMKFAGYYEKETDIVVRKKLLQQLVGGCVWAIDPLQLITDSKSEEKELASYALEALSYRKDEKVREYAFELLKNEQHMTEAISMLATNYKNTDCAFFVDMVKQIPITYDNDGWHKVFHCVMSLMRDGSVKIKPKELLPYMYHNTLCSFCREDVVKEMGRRQMLNTEMLDELLYDCNKNIRTYAYRKMKK